ncbi:Hypothetical predicted protein [Pelobates cultripes]|uniref:Uncharacterized protein n=1 Tax=Pelobates cultripes TaxID=61616 RepID=A0AAD1VKS6_PELCU|nr:Hypothetical predicted protein [Pelobates cultripes]
MNKALSKHLYTKKPAMYGKSSSGPHQNTEVYEEKLPLLTQTMIKYQEKTNKLVEISKMHQKSAVKAVPELVNRRPKIAKPSCCSGKDKVLELGRRKSGNILETSLHSGRAASAGVMSRRSGKNVETAHCSGKEVVQEMRSRRPGISTEKSLCSGREAIRELGNKRAGKIGEVLPEVCSRRPGNITERSLRSGNKAIPKLGSRRTGKIVATSCRIAREAVPEMRNRRPENIVETSHRSGREAFPKVEKRRPGNIFQTCPQSRRVTGQELKSGRPFVAKKSILEARIGSVGGVKEPTMIDSKKTECLWHQNEALETRSQEIKDICDGFLSYYKQAFLE